jgi:hypothetical protein
VKNVFDIVALVRLAWWADGQFVRVEDYLENSDLAKILKAVEQLVGGSWEIPEDLVRLCAEVEAKEAAKFEAARARRRSIVRVDFAPGYVYKDGDEKLWMDQGSDL